MNYNKIILSGDTNLDEFILYENYMLEICK
jgi:hypothetical protein